MTVKEATSSVVGCLVMVVVAAVGLAILVMLIRGGAMAAKVALPWLLSASWITLALALLVAPLTAVRSTRAFAGKSLFYLSFVFGITLWFFGLLVSYTLWGVIAVVVGLVLLGVGVVPVAMLAALVNAEWTTFLALVILTLLTFGARIAGAFAMEKAAQLEE